jgi:HlyD family secretion protein
VTDTQDEIKSTLGLKSGRRKVRVWPVLLVLFAIVGGAFVLWQAPRSDQDALGYRLAPVTRGDLTVAINATGSVEPTSMVDISSELSGTIAEVFVDFNDVVAAGEVLARLDTSKLEAQVEVQRANLRSAEARLERARVNLNEAQSTAERTRALGDRGASSDQSVIAADAALARALAELEIAEADVSVATANLLLAETDLTHACICSPVDGIVLNRTINPGQTISAAMSAPCSSRSRKT